MFYVCCYFVKMLIPWQKSLLVNLLGTYYNVGMDDVTSEMKKLLDFIDGKEPEDDFTRELDEAVQPVRKNEK